MLQRENKELRQHILDQKRREVEKDQTIAMLRQHNVRHAHDIDNLIDQFSSTMNAALEKIRGSRKRSVDNLQTDEDESYEQHSSLDEILKVLDTGLKADRSSSVYL